LNPSLARSIHPEVHEADEAGKGQIKNFMSFMFFMVSRLEFGLNPRAGAVLSGPPSFCLHET
jgi:hypothetical protein